MSTTAVTPDLYASLLVGPLQALSVVPWSSRLLDAECLPREGWRLSDCDVALFRKMKQRGFIASRNSGPYRITRDGARQWTEAHRFYDELAHLPAHVRWSDA